MDKLLESPIVMFGIYLFIVLGRAPIKEILRLIGGVSNSIREDSGKVSTAVHSGNERIFKALKQLFDIVLDVLNGTIEAIDRAFQHVTKQFTSQQENLPSRILGSIFSFVLLATFIFADAALAFQAIQTLFSGISVPEIFRNIGVALVASSVATIAALGMMFWDTVGFTDLTPLAQMKGLAKGAFIGIVILTSFFTLTCVLLIALNRAPMLAAFVQQAGFSLRARGEIHRLASLAQSLVILPMLVTTFMLFRGVYGFFVLYMMFVGAFSLLFKVTRMLFHMLKVIMVPGVNDAMASGFLFAVSEILLMGLGWIIGAALACVAAFTQILQLLLDVISLPSIKVLDFIVPVIKSLLARNARPDYEPTKTSETPIPEVLERLRSNGKGHQ